MICIAMMSFTSHGELGDDTEGRFHVVGEAESKDDFITNGFRQSLRDLKDFMESPEGADYTEFFLEGVLELPARKGSVIVGYTERAMTKTSFVPDYFSALMPNGGNENVGHHTQVSRETPFLTIGKRPSRLS